MTKSSYMAVRLADLAADLAAEHVQLSLRNDRGARHVSN